MASDLPWSRKIALVGVFGWFFLGGLGHFLATGFFLGIVPPYIPWPMAAVYLSGLLEILGALALLRSATRQWAGYGLILLTLAVTPANLHMWLHPEQFPEFTPSLLGARLLLQVMLLACIWWSTQPPPVVATRVG